jgi:DNA-binding SARP family transcriptional activator
MEEAHYGVMYCYMQMGKRDMALRQYQRCKRELEEQMKIKPGPPIQKLYQRLVNTTV